MQVEIIKGPGNSAARIMLAPNETFSSEGGSMIAMSSDVAIETSSHKKSKGSFKRGLKRLLSGESFFLNHYTGSKNGGEVILATTLPGDMITLPMTGVGLVAEGGSYVANSDGVEVDLSWQGMKSLFAGEGLFWLNIRGQGTVVLSSFGSIYSIDVDGDWIVDTGHIVAFEETLTFKVSKVGKSWISSFLGGEGFVCRFSGKGRVWCQSHHSTAFGKLLGPMLRPR